MTDKDKNKQSRNESSVSNVPGAFEIEEGEAIRTAFDRGGAITVDKNRAYLMIIILSLIILSMSVAFAILLPLEKIAPYRVASDGTGRAVADFSSFQSYTPDKANIEYQLRSWSKDMYTILGYKQALSGVENARKLLVGKAKGQFVDWFKVEKPTIVAMENPKFARTVGVTSVPILPDNVAMIHLVTTSTDGDTGPSVDKRLLITVKYLIVPPKTKEEAQMNPNGIYIQHFTVENDHD